MSRNISISDDVYHLLKREKGERSFSEVIEETFEERGNLSDVAGEKVLDRGTHSEVKEEIRKGSKGTIERLEDEDS